MVAFMHLQENLYGKCTNLSPEDQFLCDVFTCKGVRVGSTTIVVPHSSRTHQQEENKPSCWFGGWVLVLSWICLFLFLVVFFKDFNRLLHAYNSVEKIG